ncbi:MAG: methionyl-tRNA formyltransferase [Clostridia bacterium]|nr:methionyl-tRNA formyltransferase [Clostridia bacterium]
MNIVFMGTPEFADASLKALLSSEHKVQAVFTRADTPKNRGMKMLPPPVKVTALEAGIPVYQPKGMRDEGVLDTLKELAPDIIVVAAYGVILPVSVLELPKYGCINVHASLLPKYRGASPINAVLLDGEKETGVTIMQMEKGLDTGDMMLKRSIEIADDDSYGSLHDKLAIVGGELLLEALEQIENGTVKAVKQDDSLSCYAHMIRNSDAEVSFMDAAEKVAGKIRGYDPAPGAFGFLGEEKIKLFSGVFKDNSCEKEPGQIIRCDKHGLLVQANGGTVLIKEVQLSGKKKMAADACFRGRPQLLNESFK